MEETSAMAKPFARSIEGIRPTLPKPPRPQAVPKREASPFRRLQELVAVLIQEWIGQKNRDLLFALAVEKAQAP